MKAQQPLKPPALTVGDRIGLVATSWGAGTYLPERFSRAVATLIELGFEPIVMPNARGGSDGLRSWVSGSVDERLSDFHQAFIDPEIKAVLSVIGGNHSAQLLPGLDFDLIARNPKVFCGYSDTTSLLHAIHQFTGLVTFYGPALVPEFGEPDGPDPEVVSHWREVTGLCAAAGPLPISKWQSQETRMQSDPYNRNMRRGSPEPRKILRPGRSSGPLLAACLPSMLRLSATPWWPDTQGRILVVECPEGSYDPACADADICQLANMGVLGELAGLVIGRTDGWSPSDVDCLHQLVLDVTKDSHYPILAGVEVTHSAPLFTLPIGIGGSIDGLNLSIDSAAVV